MRPTSCGECGGALAADARFCTSCGAAVPGADPPTPERAAGPTEASMRLVECEGCGAPNAASRPLCAKCGLPLREEVPGGDALPDPDVAPEPSMRQREASPILLSLVLLAGLITAGVLLAYATALLRDDGGAVEGVGLQGATASSVVEGHTALAVIDGDPSTSWHEGQEGPGQDAWVEVELGEELAVRRVVLWNGDQNDKRTFADHGRASAVRLEIGDRVFRVDLLDIRGPQAVDLPDGVVSDRVRVVVDGVVDDTAVLAISEVAVEAEGR